MILSVIVFLVILSLLVLIHEAGHFLTAKKFGIKVEEFGFGFPPRVWGKKRGETLYSINLLPIGGFVKLYGEDEAGGGSIKIKDQRSKIKDLNKAFFGRPVWQRALVILAGVIMNAGLAVVIFYVFLAMVNFQAPVPCIGDSNAFILVHKEYINRQSSCNVVISEVEKNSPAQRGGITSGSKILAVNGETIIDPDSFIQIVNKNAGHSVAITWENLKTGHVYTKDITPRQKIKPNEGRLGVAFPYDGIILQYKTPLEKVLSGFTHPVNLMIFQYQAIAHFVAVYIKTGDFSSIAQNVSGPVGIASVVNQTVVQHAALRDKIAMILNLSGLLSISLAFFNVLPIPALDGGRLFFILIEGVVGKKVNPQIEGYIHAAGMVFLLGLIVLITYKDILQLLHP